MRTRPVDPFHRRHQQNVSQRARSGNARHTVLGRTQSPRLVNARRRKDHHDHHQKRDLVSVGTVILLFFKRLPKRLLRFADNSFLEPIAAAAPSLMIAARNAGPRQLKIGRMRGGRHIWPSRDNLAFGGPPRIQTSSATSRRVAGGCHRLVKPSYIPIIFDFPCARIQSRGLRATIAGRMRLIDSHMVVSDGWIETIFKLLLEVSGCGA